MFPLTFGIKMSSHDHDHNYEKTFDSFHNTTSTERNENTDSSFSDHRHNERTSFTRRKIGGSERSVDASHPWLLAVPGIECCPVSFFPTLMFHDDG